MSNLFDPDPYTKGQTREEKRRPRKPVEAATETITLGTGRWVLVGRRNARPSAHRRRGLWGTNGSIQTDCGVVGIPLTFDPGLRAGACPTCFDSERR